MKSSSGPPWNTCYLRRQKVVISRIPCEGRRRPRDARTENIIWRVYRCAICVDATAGVVARNNNSRSKEFTGRSSLAQVRKICAGSKRFEIAEFSCARICAATTDSICSSVTMCATASAVLLRVVAKKPPPPGMPRFTAVRLHTRGAYIRPTHERISMFGAISPWV